MVTNEKLMNSVQGRKGRDMERIDLSDKMSANINSGPFFSFLLKQNQEAKQTPKKSAKENTQFFQTEKVLTK